MLSFSENDQETEETRHALLKQQRMEKFKKIEPPEPGKLEKSVIYVQKNKLPEKIFMGGLFYGFSPKIGGMETGSGFSGGVSFSSSSLIL